MERHCERKMPPEKKEKWQVHPEREKENRKFGTGIIDARNKLLGMIGEKWARKPQKNASYCIEFVITCSKDQGEKTTDYLQKSLDWLKQNYQVLYATMHFDETTPHLHAYILPVTLDKQRNLWIYSSDKILGNRAKMKALQDKFYEEVAKNFGLDRGEESSRKRENALSTHHTGISQYNSRGFFDKLLHWHDNLTLGTEEINLWYKALDKTYKELAKTNINLIKGEKKMRDQALKITALKSYYEVSKIPEMLKTADKIRTGLILDVSDQRRVAEAFYYWLDKYPDDDRAQILLAEARAALRQYGKDRGISY